MQARQSPPVPGLSSSSSTAAPSSSPTVPALQAPQSSHSPPPSLSDDVAYWRARAFAAEAQLKSRSARSPPASPLPVAPPRPKSLHRPSNAVAVAVAGSSVGGALNGGVETLSSSAETVSAAHPASGSATSPGSKSDAKPVNARPRRRTNPSSATALVSGGSTAGTGFGLATPSCLPDPCQLPLLPDTPFYRAALSAHARAAQALTSRLKAVADAAPGLVKGLEGASKGCKAMAEVLAPALVAGAGGGYSGSMGESVDGGFDESITLAGGSSSSNSSAATAASAAAAEWALADSSITITDPTTSSTAPAAAADGMYPGNMMIPHLAPSSAATVLGSVLSATALCLDRLSLTVDALLRAAAAPDSSSTPSSLSHGHGHGQGHGHGRVAAIKVAAARYEASLAAYEAELAARASVKASTRAKDGTKVQIQAMASAAAASAAAATVASSASVAGTGAGAGQVRVHCGDFSGMGSGGVVATPVASSAAPVVTPSAAGAGSGAAARSVPPPINTAAADAAGCDTCCPTLSPSSAAAAAATAAAAAATETSYRPIAATRLNFELARAAYLSELNESRGPRRADAASLLVGAALALKGFFSEGVAAAEEAEAAIAEGTEVETEAEAEAGAEAEEGHVSAEAKAGTKTEAKAAAEPEAGTGAVVTKCPSKYPRLDVSIVEAVKEGHQRIREGYHARVPAAIATALHLSNGVSTRCGDRTPSTTAAGAAAGAAAAGAGAGAGSTTGVGHGRRPSHSRSQSHVHAQAQTTPLPAAAAASAAAAEALLLTLPPKQVALGASAAAAAAAAADMHADSAACGARGAAEAPLDGVYEVLRRGALMPLEDDDEDSFHDDDNGDYGNHGEDDSEGSVAPFHLSTPLPGLVKGGWLRKQAGNLTRTWQRRYFALLDNKLVYYKENALHSVEAGSDDGDSPEGNTSAAASNHTSSSGNRCSGGANKVPTVTPILTAHKVVDILLCSVRIPTLPTQQINASAAAAAAAAAAVSVVSSTASADGFGASDATVAAATAAAAAAASTAATSVSTTASGGTSGSAGSGPSSNATVTVGMGMGTGASVGTTSGGSRAPDLDYCFEIISPHKRCYLLQASSEEERMEWVLAIQKCIGQALAAAPASRTPAHMPAASPSSAAGSVASGAADAAPPLKLPAAAAAAAAAATAANEAGERSTSSSSSVTALDTRAAAATGASLSSSVTAAAPVPAPVPAPAAAAATSSVASTGASAGVRADADAGAGTGAGAGTAVAAPLVPSPYTRPPPASILLPRISAANPTCADCGAAAPEWVVINRGVLICIQCSGVHRSLGVQVSKVRSTVLDVLDPDLCALLLAIGNARFNALYEGALPPWSPKPTPGAGHEERDEFITLKYSRRAFVAKDVLAELAMPPRRLQRALFAAAARGDLVGLQKVVAVGGVVGGAGRVPLRVLRKWLGDAECASVSDYEGADEAGSAVGAAGATVVTATGDSELFLTTALHLAAWARGDALCIEYLLHNGARPAEKDEEGATALDRAKQSGFSHVVERLMRR